MEVVQKVLRSHVTDRRKSQYRFVAADSEEFSKFFNSFSSQWTMPFLVIFQPEPSHIVHSDYLRVGETLLALY